MARVCVEIDLLKPRPNRIWLGMGAGGKWQKIIYERVPKFCSHCMLRGHDNESCRHLFFNLWKKEKKPQQKSGFRKPFTKTKTRQIQTQGLRFSRKPLIIIRTTRSLFSPQIRRRLPTQLLIPPQRQSMKLNKHSQQNNCIEISSTDLIVHDPAPSALNTLIHQSTHDDINASNPPLQQSHCHISENHHSDIVPKEETLADISSNKSDSVHINSKRFIAVLFLNACIEKTGPKALQVSRSAKNLFHISSDRDCSFW